MSSLEFFRITLGKGGLERGIRSASPHHDTGLSVFPCLKVQGLWGLEGEGTGQNYVVTQVP